MGCLLVFLGLSRVFGSITLNSFSFFPIAGNYRAIGLLPLKSSHLVNVRVLFAAVTGSC